MTHTPGPWECFEWTDMGWIALVPHDKDGEPSDPAEAKFYFNEFPKDEAEANARLIAAAPDLLAALVYVKDAVDPLDYPDVDEFVDAAIAKARGAS